jgi:hypothetical protein
LGPGMASKPARGLASGSALLPVNQRSAGGLSTPERLTAAAQMREKKIARQSWTLCRAAVLMTRQNLTETPLFVNCLVQLRGFRLVFPVDAPREGAWPPR